MTLAAKNLMQQRALTGEELMFVIDHAAARRAAAERTWVKQLESWRLGGVGIRA
jgi:hypothetical protein